MRFKTTWIFTIFVIVFSSYVYYTEVIKKEKDDKITEEAKKVVSWSDKDINGLTLINNGEQIVLKKEKGLWKIVEPIDDIVDKVEINSALWTITDTKGEEVVSGDSVDFKEFGLDKPPTSLVVKKNTEEIKLSFGSVISYDSQYYVRINDDKKVQLVYSSLALLATNTLDEMRDKMVLRKKLASISSINLKYSGKKKGFSLKKKDSQWFLKGLDYPLDQSVVASLISNLENLEAKKYVSEVQDKKSMRDFLLRKPEMEFRFKDGGDAVILKLSKDKDGKMFIATSLRPVIFSLDKYKRRALAKVADDFKDKSHPFKFESNKISKLSLATGNTNIKLLKKDDKWLLTKAVPGKIVNENKVKNLISQVSSLRVKSFLGKKRGKGLRPPKNQLVLTTDDNKVVFELQWGKSFKAKVGESDTDEQEMYFVKTNKVKETLGVLVTSIDSLPKDDLLKDKPIEEKKDEKKEVKGEAGKETKTEEKK